MTANLAEITARLRNDISLPVLMKELRSRMRGVRAQVLLFIVTALAILVGLVIIVPEWGEIPVGSAPTEATQGMAAIGKSLFAGLMILEGILCALIAPALTAGAISVEREQQSLELLFLTRLSSSNIILGKLSSSLSFLLIILLCALPVQAISFLLGGVDPGQFMAALLLIVGVMALFGSIGLLCSTRFQKTTTSVAVAYAICLAWVGLLPLAYLLLEGFRHASISEEGIFILLALIIGILLTFAVVPSVILGGIYTLITRHRPTRLVNLIIWGICAILTSLLLYLPGIVDAIDGEFMLFANPILAMRFILFGIEDYSGGMVNNGTGIDILFAPVTIVFQFLFATIAVMLSVRELNSQRR
ncbi:MAG: ABC transporter permease [Armatimonadota bacterium]